MSKTSIDKSTSNLPLLHAIRGLAAFYVVVFHSKFMLWSGGRDFLIKFPQSSWNIFDYLKFGIDMLFNGGVQMVMIFFVLSGFFIAMSLDKNNNKPVLQKLKTFYLIRIVRIYIPYLASILISVMALYFVARFSPDLYSLKSNRQFNSSLIVAYNDITFGNFLKALYFDYNKEYIGFNYAYWSLLYEGIFYLIVPFIQSFKKQYLVISCIFFLSGIIMQDFFETNNVFLKFLFQFNFYFAIGQAIYLFRKNIADFLAVRKLKKPLVVGAIVLFLAFDTLATMHFEFWANFLSAISGGFLLILFLNYEIKSNYFIKSIKGLGKISYSLYLVHIPTLVFIYALLYHFTGTVVFYNRIYFIGVAASLVTGYVLYKIAEQPSIKLIKKIKSSQKEKHFKPKVALHLGMTTNQVLT
jgi:peptidoglycan/LPS O-acetylase OafA/YrhL